MSRMGLGGALHQLERLFREGALTGLGDAQLLERYRTRGDESAFEALVDAHGPMVLGLCRRMLRDPRDVEDAFQATFLVLVRKAPSIRDGGRLSSWLYGVAYRVARRARANTLRRRGREAALGDRDVPARAEADRPEWMELHTALDRELNRLPVKYRAALVLCYLQGRTHEQAAAAIGCPVGTVRSRLARGRNLLAKRLTRRGLDPNASALIIGVGSGAGSSVPARLLIETVPPALTTATVKAALGFGSSQALKAGAAVVAASVFTLTRGTLTAMKIAQLQAIGTSILAVALAAGGTAAVSYGARPRQDDGKKPAAPAAPASPAQRNAQPAPIDRLEAGPLLPAAEAVPEHRNAPRPAPIDRLEAGTPLQANRQPAPNAQPLPLDVTNSVPAPSTLQGPIDDSGATIHSTRELEARLDAALRDFRKAVELHRVSNIYSGLVSEWRDKVLTIAAQLEGLDEDITDEIERLKLMIVRKVAERERAVALMEVPKSVVARNRRLKELQTTVVSASDEAKAQGEFKAAVAQVHIVEAEIDEVMLRIKQLERRHNRIGPAMAKANEVRPK